MFIFMRRAAHLSVIIAAVCFCTQCARFVVDSQAKDLPDSSVSAKGCGVVRGKISSLEISRSGIRESLVDQEPPDVWFSFPDGDVNIDTRSGSPDDYRTDVELPEPVKALLHSYWTASLSYYYDNKSEGAQDTNTLVAESMKYSNLYFSTRRALSNLDIAAPEGTRKISGDEAGDLLQYVGARATEAVEQAKSLR